jgi:hypothetical protein
VFDQLKELGELRDSGVLTLEEFDSQKAKILTASTAPVAPTAVPSSRGFGQRVEEATKRLEEVRVARREKKQADAVQARSDKQVAPIPSKTPAAWLPDPMKKHEFRYWDGVVWTEHVASGGQASTDPLPPESESDDVAHELEDAARQEIEYPGDETDEG